jgi:gas vesicle protein
MMFFKRSRKKENTQRINFAFGTILGSIVGTIGAWLFISKQGKKFRAKLGEEFQEIEGDPEKAIDALYEQAGELAQKAKKIASSAQYAASFFTGENEEPENNKGRRKKK